ncbi:MAG: (Fe-S)-binding protein [Acidobacteriota bacterium]|nr:(Fe-S)-binding protein [Acidobacteriota bacterium]
MLSLAERIILFLLVLATIVLFFIPFFKRLLIIVRCQYANRFGSLLKRFFYTLSRVFLQLCTLKNERPWSGVAHVLVFYGALVFDTMAVNHILEGYIDGFSLFGSSTAGKIFMASVDFFAVAVLLGVIFFAGRRFLLKLPSYNTGSRDSALIYTFISLSVITYIVFSMFSVTANPASNPWARISRFLAERFNLMALSASELNLNLKITYWLHAIVVFSFISYVPHSKYFHLFAGPVNLFFRKDQPSAMIRPADLETAENFGAEKATDFTWKDALDSIACVECGRCQDVCPAFQSGKAFSPKMIILNLEKHLLSEYKAIRGKKTEQLPALIPLVFTEEEIWACTTCGACLHVCPFEIEPPDKLIDLRQNLVLSQGRFPAELQTFFHSLETHSNPWGWPASQRALLAEEFRVKTIEENPEAEYLLWLGCFGSYDEQGKKIAGAMIEILKAADISFAILGDRERCCGDSARRLGNEYLFQNLARENLKTLAGLNKINGLITFCPHGYNTLKNEYPALLDLFPDFSLEEKKRIKSLRIISHLEFLAELLKEKKLSFGDKLKDSTLADGSYAIHDSCYYGRHNGLLEQPRQILSAVLPEDLKELKNSKEHTFCCGAGGGLMWLEEKPDQRVNHLRAQEIIQNGSRLLVTSCPFCLTMLQDGLKDKGADLIKVMDIAQIIAANLYNSEQS